MDLSTLETTSVAEQGAAMEVQHPVTGAVLTDTSGAALTITLAGQDSERFRKAERRITNKRLASQAAGRRIALTSEGLETDAIERLVACTITWSGITLDGEAKDCTPENAREAYKRLPWLREQVERFVEDRANFLKTQSAS
jgi:hypothetical protein